MAYDSNEQSKKQKDRGAKDDWEALKMVLDENPSLKQKVLRRLKEMKGRKRETGVNISREAQQDLRRERNKKQKK